MAVLKIGRREVDINENDIVLFNGACWQLITRKITKGWNSFYPLMSIALCNKLIKKNVLCMVKKEREYTTQDGQQMGLYYYKFNMDNLEKYLESLKN